MGDNPENGHWIKRILKADFRKAWFGIVALVILVSGFIYTFGENQLGGVVKLIIRAVYRGIVYTSGEDLVACYLIVIVFSLSGVAAIAYFSPRIILLSAKYRLVIRTALYLVQTVLCLAQVGAAVITGFKVSLWFVIPALIISFGCAAYLASGLWLRGSNK